MNDGLPQIAETELGVLATSFGRGHQGSSGSLRFRLPDAWFPPTGEWQQLDFFLGWQGRCFGYRGQDLSVQRETFLSPASSFEAARIAFRLMCSSV